MRIVVLDAFAADQGSLHWDGLRVLGDVEVHARTSRAELVSRARGADALLTNKVLLDGEVLAQLPELKYVGVVATGTNVVDLGACRERGIAVTNVPGYSTFSVAQLVFALLLHRTHDVASHNHAVKEERWAQSPDFVFCLQPLRELADKTFTVLGMGAIGRAVARIAEAFGMRVIAGAVPGSSSVGRVPLEEALPQSDVISLHCPLTPSTTGLVNGDFLQRLKEGAVLINTGRGALVDEAALLAALDRGSLGAVALDVLTREPPAPHHPLLDPRAAWARKVIVTPHIGWATVEARERLIAAVTANLAAFQRGEFLNRVEREVGPQSLSLRPG